MSAAYDLTTLLGAGAFGTVWRASSRDVGTPCAIKVVERKRQLHEDFALEPAEAEILKKVNHPNIVSLLDLFSTEACVYLVMELVTGGHLQARLSDTGAYDEPSARVIVRQVVGAVNHLHDRSIIHRDIKPENILFTVPAGAAGAADAAGWADAEGGGGGGGGGAGGAGGGGARALEVKLTDFGLSTRKEGRLTTRCGTPSYCAPELLGGQGYGKAVDIWSIGVLSYVLLTGELPFVGKNRDDLFARIQRGAYSYPTSLPERGIEPPTDLARDLISRLLKLDAMERYSTRETLQHPWLLPADEHGASGAHGDGAPTDLTEVDPESLGTVHEMMRRFLASQRLKKAFLVVVACSRLRRVAAGQLGGDGDGSAAGGGGDAPSSSAASSEMEMMSSNGLADAPLTNGGQHAQLGD